ncbi:MAG: hypothetical protein ACI9J2_000799 [Saprospiraceae bacterium]|jgi:hypothetical protein
MRSVKTILLTIFSVLSLSSAQAQDWQLVKTDFGIAIETQVLADSPWHGFRGQVDVAAKPDQVVRFLQDLEALPSWHYRTESAEVIKLEGYASALIHIITKPLWPVKRRDVICRVSLTLATDSGAIHITLESVDNAAPPTAGVNRMDKLNAKWTIQPLGDTHSAVSYETYVEPGGKMPVWLFNTMAVDVPLYSLLNLRRHFDNIAEERQVWTGDTQ